MSVLRHRLLLTLWSITLEAVYGLVKFAGLFSKQLRKRIGVRGLKSLINDNPQEQQYRGAKRLLFFCSSAGEYEQALPIIKELEKNRHTSVIVFFSTSGYEFAKARKEKRACLLSPLDSIWRWKKILKYCSIDACFVIRHELWPSFLATSARTKLGVFLVNAGSPQKSNRAKDWIRRTLTNYFERVFLLSLTDLSFFKDKLRVPKDKICIAGDSKYDAVFQRLVSKEAASRSILKQIDYIAPAARRLIVGSAWPEDVKLCLQMLVANKEASGTAIQLFIAMHQPNTKVHGEIESECSAKSLRLQYHSAIKKANSPCHQQIDVIVVDSIGTLSEIYFCADAAFVGGAMHHKVHNVLEPAFYGLPIAFGPYYKNSQEAVNLVENSFAKVISVSPDLLRWWNSLFTDCQQVPDSNTTKQYLHKQLGASKIIVSSLAEKVE